VNTNDKLISKPDRLAVDIICHHLMLKQNESHILLKELIRNMFGFKHILLSLEIVIERISLSFVGSIATHQSHINSEPTFS
jgi:hypothetical protein